MNTEVTYLKKQLENYNFIIISMESKLNIHLSDRLIELFDLKI